MISSALRSLRVTLTLMSLFTVLFTEQIPRPLFDVIVMTYRYEWRAMSYALFMHEDYPPFDFTLSSEDDGQEPHTSLASGLSRAARALEAVVQVVPRIPQYFVLVGLIIGAALGIIVGFFVVLLIGEYPEAIRDFLVGVFRHSLRVEA